MADGSDRDNYVGTLVGESTSSEFRLAVAHEAIREQDIIAVDAEFGGQDEDGSAESIRVWAKVQRIERINPLFPSEAGHELAATRTDPLDTVLSLSREMVTAVCKVLGVEPQVGESGGKLEQLRYPAKPATTAYRPDSGDIKRIVLGELDEESKRSLDIATLANREDVDVHVDGHAIVTRHLAILAMTGAGKSWTARRIIEKLAGKNYPIVIFDPHGDYTGLADVSSLAGKVNRYYAQFPVFEESSDDVMMLIESLAWKLSNQQQSVFDDVFGYAKDFLEFIGEGEGERDEATQWLGKYLANENIRRFGIRPNLYFLADFTEALVKAGRSEDTDAFDQIATFTGNHVALPKQQAGWIQGMTSRLRTAARGLRMMEDINKTAARTAQPLPTDRTKLVEYGKVSIVSLAGYTGELQATIYSIVADSIFDKRVRDELRLPVLFLLEEAHYFAPARANTPADQRAVNTTRQIAQEGRKFGVGLTLISQRPSRLDETTLSMCNSQIIMRMINPADQNFVRRVVETLGEGEARMLPDLDVGEAILSGQLTNFPVLVKVKPPESQGEREEQDAFEALEAARRQRPQEANRSSTQARMAESDGQLPFRAN